MFRKTKYVYVFEIVNTARSLCGGNMVDDEEEEEEDNIRSVEG